MALSRRLTIAPLVTHPPVRVYDRVKNALRFMNTHGGDSLLCLPVLALALLALSGDARAPEPALIISLLALFGMILVWRMARSAAERKAIRDGRDALIAGLEDARLRSEDARQRAEDLNTAKSRFLASISHELRTPLNAILGFSEIMEAELLGRHRVKAYRAYARDIHESGRMLLGLIDELLDLSRIEAGRFDLVESEIALSEIAADCAHLVELRVQSRDLSLLLMIDPALAPLRADPRAIRQIILNLLSNAIKFTPEGGEIILEIGATKSGGQYIKVADTGPGIPAFEIPIILESFGRGTLAIKSAKEGAGLGLPIVRGLTAMHGGEFSLAAREGQGTVALITLPEERVIHKAQKTTPQHRHAA